MANFTLKQLTYFVGAAEAGTTSAAAERFFMNQSSMSAALTELEAALGVQLFIRRRGKGLELTNTGRALLPEARRLVRNAEEFGGRAGTLQNRLSGRLVVGCFDTIAPAVLPPLLHRFRNRHPDVEVDFLEGGQAELQAALFDGRIELSIMYDYDLPAGLERAVVYQPVPHILVSTEHPSAARSEVSLQEVAGDPFIMIKTSPARPLIMQAFAAAGVTPNIRFNSGNFDHIRSLVQEGMGYSMISQAPGATPAHWTHDVVAIPISDPVPPAYVVIASVPQARLTRRAQAFRDFCLHPGPIGSPAGAADWSAGKPPGRS
ncbi:LysR family transcriptional regulator [Arthrobacter sp. GCM10027362]|uniref:LysR family transcriptional regulator n=1 Tax=Arthrobacter sp. GCM10027362 TaxID=3273379 RepID=UPI0036707093